MLGGRCSAPTAQLLPCSSVPTLNASAALRPARRQQPPRHHVNPVRAAAGKGLTYKESGVDIDAGSELVRRIQKMNPSIGGFSGMVPFGEQQPQSAPTPTERLYGYPPLAAKSPDSSPPAALHVKVVRNNNSIHLPAALLAFSSCKCAAL